VLVRRDDGVVLHVPSFGRSSRLPHDLAHYVVEKELRLGRGLWGLLAAGVMLPDMHVVAGRRRPHATERSRAMVKEAGQKPTEAEVLVSLMVGIAEEGLEQNRAAVSARLNAAWKPPRSQRGPISHDEVRRACVALREMAQKWQALPRWRGVTLTWSVRDTRLSRRSKIL
jgi:hypothetical protein